MDQKKRTYSAAKLVGRVIQYMLRYYKYLFLLVVLCILITAVCTVVGATFPQTLVDDYITPMLKTGSRDFTGLAADLRQLACIMGLGVITAFTYNRIMVNVSQGTLRHLRDDLFHKMESLPIKYFDTHAHGDIMSVYTNDVDTLRQLLSQSIPQLINSGFTMVATLITMIIMSPALTVVSVLAAVAMFTVTKNFSRLSGKYFVKQQRDLGEVDGFIEEMLDGQKVVKVFCHEDGAKEGFDKVNGEIFYNARNGNRFANILMPLLGNIGNVMYVVVALVDTGIDYTHADLEGRIWVNEDEIPGNGVDDDGNGYIDDVYGWNFYSGSNQVYTGSEDSHGTHGAGTIAAHADNGIGIAGIVRSDHVKVMAVKALGGWDGSGSTASIIRAIQYAEANGARICNLSLGSSRNAPALYRTIAASDMLFVVAAGNDGADLELAPSYPASYHLDNLITVANLRYDGNLDPTSSYGASSVDLAAPGTHILSTTPGNSYSYMTGTSMAAPMVSAAAAMLCSQFPEATLADVKDILLSSVQKLDSLTGLTATGGMLDLGAAMASGAAAQKGRTWTEPDLAAYTDSPPILSLSLFQWRGQQYLTVQVQDPDGDFRSAAYAAGTYTAANFQGGAAGTPLPLNAWGAATLLVRNGGPYTFYAVDLAGNETVRTVDLPQSP